MRLFSGQKISTIFATSVPEREKKKMLFKASIEESLISWIFKYFAISEEVLLPSLLFSLPKNKEQKNASIHRDFIFPSQSIVLPDRKNDKWEWGKKQASESIFWKKFFDKKEKKPLKYCLLGVWNQYLWI